MSVSLWEALDDALIATFVAQMGEASAHADLQITGAEVGAAFDDEHTPMPAVLITSVRSEIAPESHGGGDPHVGIRYQYVASAFVVDTGYRAAKIAAQTLHARMIATLRGWRAIIRDAQAATTTDETAHQLRIRGSFIEIHARQDNDAADHIGAAYVRFDIDTTS